MTNIKEFRNKHGKAWLPSDEKKLAELFQKGLPIKELEIYFERSNNSIRQKLKRLGFENVDNKSVSKNLLIEEEPLNSMPKILFLLSHCLLRQP